MSFNRKYLCKNLCEATQAMLEYIFDAEKEEKLPYYLFGFADACYVIGDSEFDILTDIQIRMYEKNGVVVNIKPVFGVISGYMDGEEIVTIDFGQTISDMVCDCVQELLNYRKEKGNLTCAYKENRRVRYGNILNLDNNENLLSALKNIKATWV